MKADQKALQLQNLRHGNLSTQFETAVPCTVHHLNLKYDCPIPFPMYHVLKFYLTSVYIIN